MRRVEMNETQRERERDKESFGLYEKPGVPGGCHGDVECRAINSRFSPQRYRTGTGNAVFQCAADSENPFWPGEALVKLKRRVFFGTCCHSHGRNPSRTME